jgi:hypothetical protein
MIYATETAFGISVYHPEKEEKEEKEEKKVLFFLGGLLLHFLCPISQGPPSG